MNRIKDFVFGMLSGLAVSLPFSFILPQAFMPDELQEQASKKAYCKTIEEYLSMPQSPEERLHFLNKYNTTMCDSFYQKDKLLLDKHENLGYD